jgi:hypothetical protein
MLRIILSFLPVIALSAGVAISFGQPTVGPLTNNAHSIKLGALANAGQTNAVKQQPVEAWFPELIIGGEWTSTVRLTNRGSKAIPATNVLFVDNAGGAMTATFQITGGSVITDVGFSFSLPVGAILETTFYGGQSTQFGFAIIEGLGINYTASGLYAEIALKNHNATRPDFESVFPLEQAAALQYMLFDGRNGYSTVLYLVSANATAAGVSIDIVDANGNLRRTVKLNMKGSEAQLQTLHAIAPETIGIQGTLVIRADSPNTFFVATALRINPSNSFTPLRAWVPAQ